MKTKKVVGWKVPCKAGKSHRTSMVTGICRNCKKQIEEPKPWANELAQKATRAVFGN